MALNFGSDQTSGREAVWYGMPYLVVMDLVCLPRAETKGGYQGQEDQGQKGDTVPHLVCFWSRGRPEKKPRELKMHLNYIKQIYKRLSFFGPVSFSDDHFYFKNDFSSKISRKTMMK